jgi:predicted O-methyltransferase YrrM
MLLQTVNDAILSANESRTKLPDWVFGVPGFSSAKNRILLNELCFRPGTRYLEIGTWYGSTLVSAACKNNGEFYGIDNFSQFIEPGKDVRQILDANLKMLNHPGVRFTEADCMKAAPPSGIDVFFYDGNHGPVETRDALNRYKPFLSKEAIVVVDDLNLSPTVREGINAATADWDIQFVFELPKEHGWHMGLWVAGVKNG